MSDPEKLFRQVSVFSQPLQQIGPRRIHLLEAFPQVDEVVCTDLSEDAIDRAGQAFSHPKLR